MPYRTPHPPEDIAARPWRTAVYAFLKVAALGGVFALGGMVLVSQPDRPDPIPVKLTSPRVDRGPEARYIALRWLVDRVSVADDEYLDETCRPTPDEGVFVCDLWVLPSGNIPPRFHPIALRCDLGTKPAPSCDPIPFP